MAFAVSKIWLTKVISSVFPVVVKASMGNMNDFSSNCVWSPTNNTWLFDKSKYRLILKTANSKLPKIIKKNVKNVCFDKILQFIPAFNRTIWSSWGNCIKPGTIFANSIICWITFVNLWAAQIHKSSEGWKGKNINLYSVLYWSSCYSPFS